MKHETLGALSHGFHRRDLMKAGAGAVVAAMQVPSAQAEGPTDRPPKATGAPPHQRSRARHTIIRERSDG
jgi:hypothetical protein